MKKIRRRHAYFHQKVAIPTLIPAMFSLTVMTFITGLCAMAAPTLLGFDSINPEIVRLAGSSVADEAFPQAHVYAYVLWIINMTLVAMIVSGTILHLVYGVGARDLGERLDAANAGANG